VTAKRKGTSKRDKGALPRKPRKVPAHVRAAADRAAARSAGKDPLDDVPDKPATPLDPPEVAPKAWTPPKMGRPTKYRAEFCERVILLGAEGLGRAEIAMALGVDRDTLKEWAKVHAEFSAAMRYSTDYCLAFWERMGREGVDKGKDHNAASFCFQMKNRFRDDYSDRSEVAHKLDSSQAFLKLVQFISDKARPKVIEGRAA
jgi:hypothetical protein